MKTSERTGNYWPIWGTCLGFELLAHLGGEVIHTEKLAPEYILAKCSSHHQAVPLEITSEFPTSKFGRAIPKEVLVSLTNKNSTIHFHHWCLTPQNFTKYEMDKFWNILATSHDKNGLEFISLLEAKNYPIWGSQFHFEKSAYEWTLKFPKIPHDSTSILSGTFVAQFFVEHSKKNNHRFIDRKTEEENLIFNYNPFFTGNMRRNSTVDQVYFFKK